MALTALKLPSDTDSSIVIIITEDHEGGTLINWYSGNTEYVPLGKPLMSGSKLQEEKYVKKLRKDAAKKKQLMTRHSSHPEWSPNGYIEDNED